MRTFLFLFIGIGCIICSWIIIGILMFNSDSDGTEINVSTSNTEEIAPSVAGQQVITTWDGKKVSATSYVEHSDTVEVSPGEFYSNSADPDLYTIYYDEPSGNVTVLLLSPPLSLARDLAERQLQLVLAMSQSELCQYEIRVLVNAAVDETFSRYSNLGISTCPGAIVLN
jgi:hypothetical protein